MPDTNALQSIAQVPYLHRFVLLRSTDFYAPSELVIDEGE